MTKLTRSDINYQLHLAALALEDARGKIKP